jgi:hypothetical protein
MRDLTCWRLIIRQKVADNFEIALASLCFFRLTMDSLDKVYGFCLLLHLIWHFVRQFDSDCEVLHYRGFPKSVDVCGQRGILRCVRADNIVFKKCKNDYALNLSQLQIPTLTLNHITRLGMPIGIPSLTGGFSKPEQRFRRCVSGKYEFWPWNKFGEHDPFVHKWLPTQITCECGSSSTFDETFQRHT